MRFLKYFGFCTLLGLIIFSCTTEPKNNFTLKGEIKNLKKGMVYLQKDGDSSIVNLDSVQIKGQSSFTLSTNLEEPILLYLKLFKNDGEEHYIPFFADKGETTISTSLKNFNFNAVINGSKQQEILEEYLKVMSTYNDKNLDIIKESFMAQKNKDTLVSDSLQALSENLLKRKYAYTINFAMNHNNSEVAPYLALYEIPNTNIRYVDTIYNKLTDSIKNSFYGKKLEAALNEAKAAVQ